MSKVTADEILSFVRTTGRCDQEIDNDSKLFSSGLLDSFMMVELILHLETTGGFKIPPEAITLDNLDSINSILDYVTSLE